MTEYLTEQEQVEQLKKWIKQYGLTILFGIGLALLLNFGWRSWQNYRSKILHHASAVYDEMLAARAQNNSTGATAQAKKLLNNYSRTPYAQWAAFMLARDAIDNKNYPEGIRQLNWVIDHSKDNSVREIARIRIARIFIAEKQPQTALDTLKQVDDKNYIGLVDEVRGDAYLQLNDKTSAKKSYQSAINEIPNAETARPILQMKLENI